MRHILDGDLRNRKNIELDLLKKQNSQIRQLSIFG